MAATQPTEVDYVIIGAGVAGLTLAARLTEDPNVTVAVVEAGGYSKNVMAIDTPGMAGLVGAALAHPQFDWMFFTTPQENANNRPIYIPRGKGVGGSSLINLTLIGRAAAEEYDALETLGNPGWNWKSMMKYFKRSEAMLVKDEDKSQYEGIVDYDPEVHGTTGFLKTTIPNYVGGLTMPLIRSMEATGIAINKDPCAGSNLGTFITPISTNPITALRSHAAIECYEPNAQRKNFILITEAHVAKVTLDWTNPESVVATGIEYIKGGSKHVLRARREVIAAAGTIQTPQVLELSGIGDRAVLDKFGLETVIDLPGVGANLQDHPYTPVIWELEDDSGVETRRAIPDPEKIAAHLTDYQTSKTGPLTGVPVAMAFVPLNAFSDTERIEKTIDTKGLKSLELQQSWLRNEKIAQLELASIHAILTASMDDIVPKPGKDYLTFGAIMTHPFSRGTVHINSIDPLARPTVDLGLFTQQSDLEILVDGLKYVRKVAAQQPTAKVLTQEVYPGPEVQTDDEIRAHLRKSVGCLFHPIGTSAMVPREDGGVIDHNFLVYGTKNLRVVDSSILPLQLAGHTQTFIYALAEKAADVIRGIDTQ